MAVTEIAADPMAIPLAEPVSFSNRTIRYRDHAIPNVHTDSGIEGVGSSLGDGATGLRADAVESRLAPDDEGTIPLPDDPDHGVERDWNALQEYRNEGKH